MMNIKVCEINISDGKEIAAACAIERANLCTAWSEKAIIECQNNSTIKYLVAKCDHVVGICSFALVYGEGQLINIAVAEGFKRIGVGSMLLEAAIDMAVTGEAEMFTLEVEADNTKAISFYEKHQFVVAGRRKNFYGQGRDAICMIRNIKKDM